MRAILPSLLLVGCVTGTPGKEENPVAEVPSLRLPAGVPEGALVISVDGVGKLRAGSAEVGAWPPAREEVLGLRHLSLTKVLSDKPEGGPVLFRLPATSTVADFYPLMFTADGGGFHQQWLQAQGADVAFGPITRPEKGKGDLTVTRVVPHLVVSLEDEAGLYWVEGTLSFEAAAKDASGAEVLMGPTEIPTTLTCEATFAEDAGLVAACEAGRRAPDEDLPTVSVGGPLGCLVAPASTEEEVLSWRKQLVSSLETVDQTGWGGPLLVAEKDVSLGVILPLMGAFHDYGKGLPTFSHREGLVENSAPPACPTVPPTARAVQEAGATWLGRSSARTARAAAQAAARAGKTDDTRPASELKYEVEISELTVEGPLDVKSVQKSIDAAAGTMTGCYKAAARKAVWGTVLFTMEVGADGEVGRASFTTKSAGAEQLGACISGRLQRLRFPIKGEPAEGKAHLSLRYVTL